METDNDTDCGFDRERHIADVRYLARVAVGCYAVAALLGIAGTITRFLTSELQPLLAFLPAAVLAYIGEKYIERMYTEIVERIGEDGAAQVGVPCRFCGCCMIGSSNEFRNINGSTHQE